METHYRSLIKALSWRILATVITFSVVMVLTGKLEMAATIGLADTLIKLGIYYGHERLWAKINFGRLKRPEYEI
ncbi:MAG: DUF2061 domain-containing protein [Planctomycetes bacterium]|nr:DUF2061 domain-containing protein [Planctomycetota bacterium]